jgi:hypothetical protein
VVQLWARRHAAAAVCSHGTCDPTVQEDLAKSLQWQSRLEQFVGRSHQSCDRARLFRHCSRLDPCHSLCSVCRMLDLYWDPGQAV